MAFPEKIALLLLFCFYPGIIAVPIFNATDFFSQMADYVPEIRDFKKGLSSKDATVLQAVSKIGPMSEEEAFNAIKTQSPVLASNLTLLKSNLYNKIINMEGRHSKQFAYDTFELIGKYQSTLLSQTRSNSSMSTMAAIWRSVLADFNKLPNHAVNHLANAFPELANFTKTKYFQQAVQNLTSNGTSSNSSAAIPVMVGSNFSKYTNVWSLIPQQLMTYPHLQVYLPPSIINYANVISPSDYNILVSLPVRHPSSDAATMALITSSSSILPRQIRMINATVFQQIATLTNNETRQFFLMVLELAATNAQNTMDDGEMTYANLQAMVLNAIQRYNNLSSTAKSYIKQVLPTLGDESLNSFHPKYNLSTAQVYLSTHIPEPFRQFIPPYILDFVESLSMADVRLFMSMASAGIDSEQEAWAYIRNHSSNLADRIETLNETIFETFANITNDDARNFINNTLMTACALLQANLQNFSSHSDPEAAILILKEVTDMVVTAFNNLSSDAQKSLSDAFPTITLFFQSPFWELIEIVVDSAGTNDSIFNMNPANMIGQIQDYIPPYVLNFTASLTQADMQVLMAASMMGYTTQAACLAFIKMRSPTLAVKIIALNNTIYANVSNNDGRNFIYNTIEASMNFSQTMMTMMTGGGGGGSPNITAMMLLTLNFTMEVVNNFTSLSSGAKQSLATAFPTIAKLVQSTIFRVALCVLKIFYEYPETFSLFSPVLQVASSQYSAAPTYMHAFESLSQSHDEDSSLLNSILLMAVKK